MSSQIFNKGKHVNKLERWFRQIESLVYSKRWWVDALALVVSSIPYGMGIEMLLWRKTFIQSVSIRAVSILPDLFVGGPYGRYQEWIMRKSGYRKGQWLKFWATDSFAFTTFQGCLYIVTILLTWLWVPLNKQASWTQVAGSLITLAVTSPVGGWLFRVFQDLFFWLFKVKKSEQPHIS